MNFTIYRYFWKTFKKSLARPSRSSSWEREFSRTVSVKVEQHGNKEETDPILHFQNAWPPTERLEVKRDMIVVNDFISESEEQSLVAEAEKSLKRMRYQYDHWDDAIHGYREMEKVDWLPENRLLFERVRRFAFETDIMPHVHILDLAKDGIIKPHVDSSRYCGTTIAGLSLLTDCIMRLRRVDEKKYEQPKIGEANASPSRNNGPDDEEAASKYEHYVDALLRRRSLYVMKDTARYNFTHEVLAPNAEFNGCPVDKGRRISIICRNQP